MKLAALFIMAIASLILFGTCCVMAAFYSSKYLVYESGQNFISAAISFGVALSSGFLFIDTIRDMNKC